MRQGSEMTLLFCSQIFTFFMVGIAVGTWFLKIKKDLEVFLSP